MDVLITAGGTSEAIDTVRKITNTSTGRLAVSIYQELLQHKLRTGQAMTIHYVVAAGAILPDFDAETIVYHVTDTKSVDIVIQEILSRHKVDIVLHLMAISDYYVASVKSSKLMVQNLSDFIQACRQSDQEISVEILEEFLERPSNGALSQKGKLSSKDDLYLQLKQTPKIIQQIKSISPECRLIGFKLMDKVSEEVLIETASQQCKLNRCEFVVANDLRSIGAEEHHALLVKDGQVLNRCVTKDAIAASIIKELGL